MTEIEDNFKPETATEVALLHRIRELKIKLMNKGYDPVWSRGFEDGDLPVPHPPPLRLFLAASVESEWDQIEGLKISAKSIGNSRSISYSYYVSHNELNQMTSHNSVRMLEACHKRLVLALGDLIIKGEL